MMTKSKKSQGATRKATKSKSQPFRLPQIRWVLACASLVVLSVAVYQWRPWNYFHNWVNRPIAQVVVDGPFHFVEQATVQKLLDAETQKNILNVDLHYLKARLENNPWIDFASVARRWPDRLEVSIQEQQPIALWGQNAFLNMRGDIIRVESMDSLQHLPLLAGRDDDAKDVMQKYLQIKKMFATKELIVSSVKQKPTQAWVITLQEGVQIRAGRGELFEKLQRFLAVYQQDLKQQWHRVASIDLRYEKGLAVAWRTERGQNSLMLSANSK